MKDKGRISMFRSNMKETHVSRWYIATLVGNNEGLSLYIIRINKKNYLLKV